MSTIEIQKVTKKFGDFVAVRDADLSVKAGEVLCLLGPSGCGKTTTLRMIAGLELTSEGRISIGDKDVTLLSAAERDVSMVFQSYALFPHMTVIENAAYGPIVSGIKKARAYEMAREKLQAVGLKGYDDRLPSELSGGQQQRVAVARALVLEPQVLLFDEPLSNLDAKLRRQVRDDIRELQQKLNLTVAYVTHDQGEALAVSDRIIVMSNARIAQSGTPRDLYESPASAFVADFIGDANLIDVQVTPIDDARAEVRVGNVMLNLPRRGVSAGPAKIAVRPTSLRLSRMASGPAIPGKILKAAYLGGHMEYTVTTDAGERFVIDENVRTPFTAGSDVAIAFADHGVTLVPIG